MNPRTTQAVLDSLLDRQTNDPAVLFARGLAHKMLGADTAAALRPIFTRMNGYHPGWYHGGALQDGILRLPVSDSSAIPAPHTLRQQMETALLQIAPTEENLELLLDTLEQYAAPIPAADDISEFDHRKMVAAIAACAAEYPGEISAEEPMFLLYTADFSGIQKFIYTVSTANALKALRSRSFFLELTMEHYIDELLSACGLNRVNLLYSGGGHCYVLLPNTQAVIREVDGWNRRFNDWLCSHFGIHLYLADGYVACTANDLTNTPADKSPYKEMFRRVSSAVSKKKLKRYTPEQILTLNHPHRSDGLRECQVCGTESRLRTDSDGRSLCSWCSLFESLSGKLLSCQLFVVQQGTEGLFVLPGHSGDRSVSFCTMDEAGKLKRSETIVRVYGKNCIAHDLPHSIRLFFADYAAEQQMGLLAQESEGIRRIGVCRMDVDNLGQSFVAGFEQDCETAPDRQRYVTLMRTSAFSRQMSLFFKCYLNQVLSGVFEDKPALMVTVVYAGGDDVFLVGAWTDVIEASLRIRNAFHRYTCGALTLSAGIGLFQETHPIRLAATETADLEDEAKSLPGKDAISLFAPEQNHVYHWPDFEKLVLEEKLGALKRFFSEAGQEYGNSFLYNVYELLCSANEYPGKSMPLARLAYLLAKACPPEGSTAEKLFKDLSEKIYHWALDPAQRCQLITAIQLYAYMTRKIGGVNHEQ